MLDPIGLVPPFDIVGAITDSTFEYYEVDGSYDQMYNTLFPTEDSTAGAASYVYKMKRGKRTTKTKSQEDSSCPKCKRWYAVTTGFAFYHVDTTIRLPKWTGYANASAAEKQEWDRFMQRLLWHEVLHVVIYREYNVGRHWKGTANDCDPNKAMEKAKAAWEKAAIDYFNSSKAEIDRRTEEYDRITNHGRNQGAVLHSDPEEQAASYQEREYD